MGQLKQDATLIYERHDGMVYSREFGADPASRVLVGYDYDPRTSDGRPLHDHIQEDQMWGGIRRLGRTNAVLGAELDRVVATYHLIKNNG